MRHVGLLEVVEEMDSMGACLSNGVSVVVASGREGVVCVASDRWRMLGSWIQGLL